MDALLNILNAVKPWLLSHEGTILSVASFALVFLAKVFPNANAGIVMGSIQKFVDLGAKLCFALGDALHASADFLGKLIQSDGILGKK
jgi:hypothetical protein